MDLENNKEGIEKSKFYIIDEEQKKLMELSKKIESEDLPYSYGGSSGK